MASSNARKLGTAFPARPARRALLALVACGALLGSVAGCERTTETISYAGPGDLDPYVPGEESIARAYQHNELVDDGSFADTALASGPLLQLFLERTPYQRRSFLSTYQSNGLRASDALVAASNAYRINPLILLALLQVRAGLVSLELYPDSPNRVEYAFECGCTSSSVCDARRAGLDKQLACVALTLRNAFDSVLRSGVTAAGFGKDRPSVTVDGVFVTPTNAATAALYELLPREALRAEGGVWHFWNLWAKFTEAAEYEGPFVTPSEGGAVGDPCVRDEQCAIRPTEGGFCNSSANFPGGMCSATCTDACEGPGGKPAGFCADFKTDTGFCLPICNPSAPNCRPGYTCARVAKFKKATEGASVCYPQAE